MKTKAAVNLANFGAQATFLISAQAALAIVHAAIKANRGGHRNYWATASESLSALKSWGEWGLESGAKLKWSEGMGFYLRSYSMSNADITPYSKYIKAA